MADVIKIFGSNAPTGSEPIHKCANIMEACAWIMEQEPDEVFDIALPGATQLFSGISAKSAEGQLSK